MKSSLRVLSGSLLAATIGTTAFGGLNGAAAFGSQDSERVGVILVGASGRDTVSGLMPLSLWPRAAVAQGSTPAWQRLRGGSSAPQRQHQPLTHPSFRAGR
jgi:hypothetical protein